MEIWKDIKGYEGFYQISNLGNVKSLSRLVKHKQSYNLVKEKIMKQFLSKSGYLIVRLNKNKIGKTYSIHQLIAINFLNHIQCGFLLVIDHIDNNKLNNALDNLQIITNRQNTSKRITKYSSKYVGVSFDKKNEKWMSSIRINGKSKHLGRFNTEEEARNKYLIELNKINDYA